MAETRSRIRSRSGLNQTAWKGPKGKCCHVAPRSERNANTSALGERERRVLRQVPGGNKHLVQAEDASAEGAENPSTRDFGLSRQCLELR